MSLKKWFGGRGAHDDEARAIYQAVVAQARLPAFYGPLAVPDTVDGRFEMICLHAFLVMRRLKAEPQAAETAQALFNTMFEDMDYSLREMGAGDLGVGKRVKGMAKAFYGRIAAYEAGLGAGEDELCAALKRNLYRGAAPEASIVARMAAYLAREDKALQSRGVDDIIVGSPGFGAPELGEGEAAA